MDPPKHDEQRKVVSPIVAPGNLDLVGLLKHMGTGLLVTELMGQGLNMVTGDYSRGAAGYWVENGEIVHPVEEFTFSDWKKMLAIHLDGAFLTTRACLRHMYAQGKGGSIILMGSVHSKEASLLKAPYVTAKHGLTGLTKTVALEVATFGITVNCIPPGRIHSEQIFRNYTPEYRQWQCENEIPMGRYGEPEDLANLVCFLSSPLASYITGAVIPVDGGLRRYQF